MLMCSRTQVCTNHFQAYTVLFSYKVYEHYYTVELFNCKITELEYGFIASV